MIRALNGNESFASVKPYISQSISETDQALYPLLVSYNFLGRYEDPDLNAFLFRLNDFVLKCRHLFL